MNNTRFNIQLFLFGFRFIYATATVNKTPACPCAHGDLLRASDALVQIYLYIYIYNICKNTLRDHNVRTVEGNLCTLSIFASLATGLLHPRGKLLTHFTLMLRPAHTCGTMSCDSHKDGVARSPYALIQFQAGHNNSTASQRHFRCTPTHASCTPNHSSKYTKNIVHIHTLTCTYSHIVQASTKTRDFQDS